MARSPPTKEIDVTPHVEENLDVDTQLRTKAELYKNKGNDEFRKNEFSKAEKLYTEGIKVKCKDDELNAKLYNNRATAHFYLGNYLESLDDAKSAIHLQPNYIKAIQRGAIAYVQLHLYEEAITWCVKGLAIDKENRTLLDLKSKSVDVISKLPAVAAREGESLSQLSIRYEEIGDAFYYRRDYKAAIHYYVRYLKITEQLEDRAGQGRAHTSLGNAYFDVGNFKAAITYHERHLELAIEMEDIAGGGRAIGNLGAAYHSLGNSKYAIHCYEHSLKIAQQVGDGDLEKSSYGNLVKAYTFLGDLGKASDYHEHHLKIVKKLGDRAGEAGAYTSFANIYLRQGNFTKAIEYHQYALDIAQELGEREREGGAYLSLGNDYCELGNFKKAIHYYQRALEIFEEFGDRSLIGKAYCNLGICYERIGETERGIDYLDRLLKIAKEVGDKEGEGNAYGNLGSAYISLGNFEKARDYFQRYLTIAKETGNRATEGLIYCSLGVVYRKLRHFEKAIDHLERGLTIHKEVGDKSTEGATYGNLGNVYQSLGDFKTAIEYHELHLKNAQELGKRDEEGGAYHNLANDYCMLGDLQNGISYYTVGLEIAKEVGDREGEAKNYYALGCCYESLERNKALRFYQASVKILNDLRDGLQSKDEWKISVRHLYQDVYNNLWALLLKEGKVMEALSAAEQGRAQALKDLLHLNYGRFECPAEDTMDATLHCLPSNTVFIAVHKRGIVYWVIRKGNDVQQKSKEIGDIPAKDAVTFLQSLIDDSHEKLGLRADVKCEDRSLDKLSDDVRSRERSGQTAPYSPEIQTNALRTLYDVVIGPIEEFIRDSDELTIVPDGPLCLVPYSALMDSRSKYLGESFRIRLLPSLNSFKLIADSLADYHCKTGALLVGDPCVKGIVFGNGGKLCQLENAKEEVEMIGRIIKCTPLIGTEATKSRVLEQISSVALVHIAAHGRMETGEIALAPNHVPNSAQVQEQDYLLTIADVLKVKLRAQLVVLSCCHSGRGEIKAEGVVGIARAFLGAGARSVLVSLWAIDDEATLLFMKFFYEHLLQGKRASEALQQAMKCMRESDNELSKVKYWAPFVLIGDDVTLEFGGTEKTNIK